MYIHICAPGIFFSIISNIISGQMEKTQNMMICIVVLLYSFHCANVLVRKQCMGVKYNGVVDTLKVRNCEAKYKWKDLLWSPSLNCLGTFQFKIDPLSCSVRNSTFYFSWFFYKHRNLRAAWLSSTFCFFPFPVMFNFTTIFLKMRLGRAEMCCISSVTTYWKKLTIVYRLYNTFRWILFPSLRWC